MTKRQAKFHAYKTVARLALVAARIPGALPDEVFFTVHERVKIRDAINEVAASLEARASKLSLLNGIPGWKGR